MNAIPDPQDFRAAADVIRENGLCKGWMVDGRVHPDPAKCPMSTDGSIRFVVSGKPDATDAAAVAATDWFDEFMHTTVPGYSKYGDYVGWNDAADRTEAEVLAALEQAACSAEAARATGQTGGETDAVIVDWDTANNDPDAVGFDDLAHDGGGSRG